MPDYQPRETAPERVEIHVNGVLFRLRHSMPVVLVGKRSPDRSLFPGLWEIGCGGQLKLGEGWSDGVRRHYTHDLGIFVQTMPAHASLYEIREIGAVIPGVRMLCAWIDGSPDPRSPRYDAFDWQSIDGLRMSKPDFIPGSVDEAIALIEERHGVP